MSSNSADATGERQRQREGRGLRRSRPGDGPATAPRQRRPALAALALLLIVGGALTAGLLAIRMDAREPVIVAREDIPPGTQITAEMLAEAQVSSDVLQTIPADLADQVVGAYTTTTIPAEGLVEERALAASSPVTEGNSVVGLTLTPGLSYDGVAAGDLVRIYRVSGGSGESEDVGEISQGLVLSVTTTQSDDLGGAGSATASLLVPADVAGDVIDASSGGIAGIALDQPGQSTEVELRAAPDLGSGLGTDSGSDSGSGDEGDGE